MEKLLKAVFGRSPDERADEAISSGTDRIPGPPPTPIAVREVPEDVPAFAREYTARLDQRAVIKVTAKTYSFRARSFSGELTQPNGNRIWFEPERIADKIIDPLLVPLVEKAWAEIREMDRAFIASQPDRFTDEKRQVWVRA